VDLVGLRRREITFTVAFDIRQLKAVIAWEARSIDTPTVGQATHIRHPKAVLAWELGAQAPPTVD